MQSLHKKIGLLFLVPVVAIIAILVVLSVRTAPRADEMSERYAKYQECIINHAPGTYTEEQIQQRCQAIWNVSFAPTATNTPVTSQEPTPYPVFTTTLPEPSETPLPVVTDDFDGLDTPEQVYPDTNEVLGSVSSPSPVTTTTPTPGSVTTVSPNLSLTTAVPSPVVTVTPQSTVIVTPPQKEVRSELKDLYKKTNELRVLPTTNEGHTNPKFREMRKDPNFLYTNGQFVYSPEQFKSLRDQGYTGDELYAMCITEYDEVYGRNYRVKNGTVQGVYAACNELTKYVDDAPKTLSEAIDAYFSTYGSDRGHKGMPAQHCLTIFNDAQACREAIMANPEMYAVALNGLNVPDDPHTQSTSWSGLRLLFGHLPADEALDACQKYTNSNVAQKASNFAARLIKYNSHGGGYRECIDALAGHSNVPTSKEDQLALLIGSQTPTAINDILRHACDASPVGKKSGSCALAAERYAAYREVNPNASMVDVLKYVYTQDDLFSEKTGHNEFVKNPKQLANFINEISRHIDNHYIDMKRADIRKAMGINESERTLRDRASELLLDVVDNVRQIFSR